jgi:hypothetical protein
MLLEVESRERVAPSVVQSLSRFLSKFDISTGKIWEEEAGLTDPNPGTVMSFLIASFLLRGSSDLLGRRFRGMLLGEERSVSRM